MTTPASLADFKTQFDRDFPFGTGFDTVRDNDITKALDDANPVFNSDLFDASEVKNVFLYAAAFFLVENLKAAGGLTPLGKGQGASSSAEWAMQSKSVGDVSVAYALPRWVTEDAILGAFARNAYGQKYLSLVLPRLVGPGAVVPGWDDTNVVAP